MKFVSKFNLLALLLAMSLVLAACPAPAAPPAADSGGDDAAASEEAGDAEADASEEETGDAEAGDAEAAGGCEDAIGCIEVAEGDTINIAGMLAASGPVAFLGEDSQGGIEIAVAERGEIMGYELSVTIEDSTCNAEGGQTAAQKIAADPSIAGVVGTNCSGAAAAALPVLSDAGLILISPSNTSPWLTNPDPDEGGLWAPGYYRTAHNDLFQGAIAAAYAYNELGARTIATVHDGDPYTDGLQGAFADAFVALGGEISYQGAVNKGDNDMRPILTELASSPPDVLYFPLFEPEVNFMAAQSVEFTELENTILMGADAALVEGFPENTGDAAEGMYLSGPYLTPEGAYGDFLAKWDEEYGGTPPSGFHAHAYDATNMLLDAIEASAMDDGNGGLLIGRQAIRDALSATSGFEGLTGVLTCDEYGDCATGEALGIFQITKAEIDDDNWPPEVIWVP